MATPILDLNGVGAGNDVTANFVEGTDQGNQPNDGVLLFQNATLTEGDSQEIKSITLTLPMVDGSAFETLGIDNAFDFTGINVVVNVANGSVDPLDPMTPTVMTLTPETGTTASVADFQAVLQAIRYFNTSDEPSETPRSVTVDVVDAEDETTTQTATINVEETNDIPALTVEAGDNSTTEDVDASASGAFTVTDPDSDTFTWQITAPNETAVTAMSGTPAVSNGTYGTLSLNDDGSWSYTLDDTLENALLDALDAGETVQDNFVVLVNDNEGAATTAPVTINVTGTNDAPVAEADLTTFNALGDPGNVQVVDEDGPTLTIDVLANDTDVDGEDNPSNFSLDSVGANSVTGLSDAVTIDPSSFDIVGNQLTFTPGDEFDALDDGETAVVTVSYTMSDDSGESATSTASITVTGTNDAPTVSAIAAPPSTEDETVSIDLLDGQTDPDDDLTVGNIVVTSNVMPARSFVEGEDYTVTDGVLTFAAGTFNDLNESASEIVTVNYEISDGTVTSPNTAIKTVTGVNDAPVAGDDEDFGTIVDPGDGVAGTTMATGNVLDNDTDDDTGETASLVVDSFGTNAAGDSNAAGTTVTGTYGTLTIDANGVYTYTLDTTPGGAADALPDGDVQVDTFFYVVSDFNDGTDVGRLQIDVTGSNEAPTVTAALTGTDDDQGIQVFDLLDGAEDRDTGDTLSVTGLMVSSDNTERDLTGYSFPLSGPGNGTLDFDAAQFDDLRIGDTEVITFSYTIEDNFGGSVPQTLTVTLTGTNQAPVVGPMPDDAGEVIENGTGTDGVYTATGDIDFTDAELGDIHSVNAAAAGGGLGYLGTLLAGISNSATADGVGRVTWTYNITNASQKSVIEALGEGDTITQLYTITINDGQGGSTQQDVTITITGSNDQPVIEGSSTLTDTLTETADTTGSMTVLEATGTIAFSDIDTSTFANANTQALVTGAADTHTVGQMMPTATLTPAGGAAAAYMGMIPGSLSFGVVDQTADTVDWTYSVADGALDFLREGDVLTITFATTVTDDSGAMNADSESALITVTITGTNDVPTIAADEVNGNSLVEAGVDTPGVSEVTGTLNGMGANWDDADDSETAALAVTKAAFDGAVPAELDFDGSGTGAMPGEATILGTYGALYLQVDGSYRYVLDNADPDTDALDNEATGVTETFTYTIANNGGGEGNEASATITVSIEGSNDAPFISFVEGEDLGNVKEAGILNDNVPFSGVTTATGTLDPNDVDSSDDATNDTWSLVANGGTGQIQDDAVTVTGTYGTLTIDQNGTWTYTLDDTDPDTRALNEGESYDEVFTVQLADNDATDEGSDTVDVTITVTGTNDQPVLTVVPGADTSVTEAGLSLVDNTTPIGDNTATGAYTVADDDSNDTPATALWSIVSVNGVAVETPTVANGAPSAETGQYGTLSLNDMGQWTYLIDDTEGGAADALDVEDSDTETFVIRVADGNGGFDEATITVSVQGSNDGPVANVDATTFVVLGDAGNVQVVDEDGPTLSIDVLANDTDVDGDDGPANFSLDVIGTNSVTGLTVGTIDPGSFVINGSMLEFTPGAEFDELAPGDTAVVTVAYTMSDDSGAESSSTVTITVTGSNDAPVIEVADPAFDDTETLAETDAALLTTGRIVFSDIDSGDTPEASVDTSAASVVATGVMLSPEQEDAFRAGFSITDPATGAWEYALAAADSQFLALGDQVDLTFTVTVTDDFMGTATRDVTITITGTNDAPVAVADTNAEDAVIEDGVVAGDGTAVGNVLGNDSDVDSGDILTVVGVEAGDTGLDLDDAGTVGMAITGTYGTLTIGEDGEYTYTLSDTLLATNALAEDDNASDVFTYTISDGNGGLHYATLTIDITGANDAPVAVNDSGTTDDDNAVTVDVLANDTDVDTGDEPATFTLDSVDVLSTTGLVGSPAAFGSATIVGNQLVFDPGLDFEELDTGESATVTVTYTMSDSNGATSTAAAVITVNGTNDAPFVVDIGGLAANVTENPEPDDAPFVHSVNEVISFNDFEINDTHSVTVVADSGGGSIAFGETTTPHPTAAYYGTFSGGLSVPATGSTDPGEIQWAFSVDDDDIDHLAAGEVVTQNYTVTIVDNGAGNLSATETIVVTITGTNDAPVITTAAASANLTEAADQTGEATPALTASGSIAFDDVDARDTGHTATVSASVASTVATDFAETDDPAILGYFSVTDTDAGTPGVQVTKADGATSGSASWSFSAPDNAFDFLAEGETATLTYTVTIDDGDGGTDDHVVTITITGSNDAPVAVADTNAEDAVVEDMDASATGNVLVNDTDVDAGDSKTVVGVAAGDTGADLDDAGTIRIEILGTYGRLTVSEMGDYSYVLDDTLPATDALAEGESASDVFTYTMVDAEGASSNATLTIAITGSNDAPVLGESPDLEGSVVEDSADPVLTDSGVIGFSDVDLSDTHLASAVFAGSTHSSQLGNLSAIVTAATVGGLGGEVTWSFSVDNAAVQFLAVGESIVETYTVTLQDAAGASFTQDVSVTITGGVNTVTGTELGETLTGTADEDAINGFGGADTLIGGAGADALDGGDGSDTASYAGSSSQVRADLANPGVNLNDAAGDTYASIENLTGTAFDDNLRGNALANVIIAGAGADKLYGRDGDDTLEGGAGADILVGDTGVDTASYAGAAAGVLADLQSPGINTGDAAGDSYVSIENLAGSQFADNLRGDGAANLLSGSAGDDSLYGRSGNDTLEGGAGADFLAGGGNTDTASYAGAMSGVTADLVAPGSNTGDAAGDTYASIENLLGSGFDDMLSGGAGANRLTGGLGDDTLEGRGGADTLDGGSGTDTASYATATSLVRADLANAAVNLGDAAGDSYLSIENLIGTGFDDNLRGDGAANVMMGGAGSDRLYGRGGDDTLEGGAGADLIAGGAGTDTASYASASGLVRVDLETPGINLGDAAGDTFDSIENLIGTQFADNMRGNAGANVMDGGAGDDRLYGRDGDDTLIGGSGDNLLAGGAGADHFVFNDTLGAGESAVLDYEDGIDTLVFQGLAGSADPLAELALTDVTFQGVSSVSMDYEGHTIIVKGVTTADLTAADDFLFT